MSRVIFLDILKAALEELAVTFASSEPTFPHSDIGSPISLWETLLPSPPLTPSVQQFKPPSAVSSRDGHMTQT